MATDALLSFNSTPGAANTVTATGASSAVAIPGVQRSTALYIRIRYRNFGNAAGTNTVQFSVSHYAANPPAPNAAGYYDHVVDAEKKLTFVNGTPASSSATSGEIFLPVSTGSKQIKLAYTFGGAGSTPTIDFIADLVHSNV